MKEMTQLITSATVENPWDLTAYKTSAQFINQFL